MPNRLMQDYYVQRASAGLIITEATSISPQGVGYHGTPGIWSEAHVEGWRAVTEAVHASGGRIMLQLWHVGRISDPEFFGGPSPVAPSAVKPAGQVSLLRPKRDYVEPRALETNEVVAVVEDFRKGAENAKRAGFDGVEVHAANGYLVDQFLQDKTNKRIDHYGGSIENRMRFLMEIVDALSSVWKPDRIGVHLRPRMEEHDMGDSDPSSLFERIAVALGQKQIGFLFVREIWGEGSQLPNIKKRFGGAVIANELMSRGDADRLISEGHADAVAFGRDYIANPDLVERIALDARLNDPDPSTFFANGSKGYTDYPRLLGLP